MPSGDRIGFDDDQPTGPPWLRLAKRHPEGSIDVLDRWARALFLQRGHLLPQCEGFDHEVGSPTTHRPQRTDAKRDEEDENTEHDAGVSPSLARNSSDRESLSVHRSRGP